MNTPYVQSLSWVDWPFNTSGIKETISATGDGKPAVPLSLPDCQDQYTDPIYVSNVLMPNKKSEVNLASQGNYLNNF